jgi:hypothetical protein
VLDSGLADFADLYFLFTCFLLIEYLYILPFADQTFTTAMKSHLPYSLSSVGL